MNDVKKISFVIPVYNEEKNIEPLLEEISAATEKLQQKIEVIFVNDGSRDNSLAVLQKLAKRHKYVKYHSFQKNKGQSAALAVGFQLASGEVTVTLDADLQNDPKDVPMMLKYFGKYDMITGWRTKRDDSISKKIASKVGNGIRNMLTGEHIHDTGCSLKVMRTSMLKQIKMYRGLHRFLPTLMRLQGAKVFEVAVNHRPRIFGKSNYTNLGRAFESLYDLIAVRWMINRNILF